MIDDRALRGIALSASLVLFAMDLALSVFQLSVTSLSRVALRRLDAESGGRLRFLAEIKTIPSPHRSAIHATRQFCLIAGAMLVGLGSGAGGAGGAAAISVGAGAAAVVVLETLLARYLALKDPRKALRITGRLVRPIHAATYPLLGPVHAIVRRWAGSGEAPVDDREDDADEEVEAFIEVGEREGILEPQEGEMVRGIVDLGETLVREVMVPRTDIVALSAASPVAEARKAALEAGHSRYPVYGEGVDNVVGILHVRDLLRAWAEGREDAPISDLVRPALFVPETQTVAELLGEMRRVTHIALVVDEYGGLAGLVTLEDLLEEIVGDIRDEHDADEASVQAQPDGSFVVAGLAHVEEVEDLFGVDFGDREYDTVGGFVVASLGRVPETGESFNARGLSVEVLEADPRRVYSVRIRRQSGGPAIAPSGR